VLRVPWVQFEKTHLPVALIAKQGHPGDHL
jgi:hypothetical protein